MFPVSFKTWQECKNPLVLSLGIFVCPRRFFKIRASRALNLSHKVPYILVVAPFLISQCYNSRRHGNTFGYVVAPFLISQCYNALAYLDWLASVVAPFLISQCYNGTL